MQGTVADTPMYAKNGPLHGDKETVQRKCGRPSDIEDCSHRPGYMMSSRYRPMKKGAARKMNIEQTYAAEGSTKQRQAVDGTTIREESKNIKVAEDKMSRAMWALRRTPINSRLKCFGLIDGKKKCNALSQSSSTGVVAPSFYSE